MCLLLYSSIYPSCKSMHSFFLKTEEYNSTLQGHCASRRCVHIFKESVYGYWRFWQKQDIDRLSFLLTQNAAYRTVECTDLLSSRYIARTIHVAASSMQHTRYHLSLWMTKFFSIYVDDLNILYSAAGSHCACQSMPGCQESQPRWSFQPYRC
jgi:hypothetical protein